MFEILVINGPNLNLLGEREKNIYGTLSLDDINDMIKDEFKNYPLHIDFFQSNCEGDLINKIHKSRHEYAGIVINPGAYSHYSIAIMDAIKSIDIPVVEIHLSNIYNREEYRRNSVTAAACVGVISGFGHFGYIMAVNSLIRLIEK
jgi:3-dehydroquinate dehydratase-2